MYLHGRSGFGLAGALSMLNHYFNLQKKRSARAHHHLLQGSRRSSICRLICVLAAMGRRRENYMRHATLPQEQGALLAWVKLDSSLNQEAGREALSLTRLCLTGHVQLLTPDVFPIRPAPH